MWITAEGQFSEFRISSFRVNVGLESLRSTIVKNLKVEVMYFMSAYDFKIKLEGFRVNAGEFVVEIWRTRGEIQWRSLSNIAQTHSRDTSLFYEI